MVLHYPKEGAGEEDEWVDMPIPESYVSMIKKDSIVTAE